MYFSRWKGAHYINVNVIETSLWLVKLPKTHLGVPLNLGGLTSGAYLNPILCVPGDAMPNELLL